MKPIVLATILLALAASACGGRAGAIVTPQPTPSSTEPISATASPTPLPLSSAGTALPSQTAVPSVPIAAPRELQFVAFATGDRFHVQADPAARDVGHFVYSLLGRGAYSGFLDTALHATSTDVTIDYKGPVTFISTASPGPSATAAPVGTVSAHLTAHLDPVAHTGTVALTDGGRAFTLNASVPSVADLDPVMSTFERAMVAADGDALYTVMNSDITGSYTPAAFGQQIAAGQAQNGRVTALRRLSVGPPLLSDLGGFWLVTAEYEASEVSPAGAPRTTLYSAFFVRERAGWKVLSTSAH